MQIAFTPEEIAGVVQPQRVAGTSAVATIHGIASLNKAEPGDLSFLGNKKYKAEVAKTRASVVLVPLDFAGTPAPGQSFLYVDQPSVALGRLCARLERALWPQPVPGVHPSASVAPDAVIDPTATVGPLCVVEAGARIGAGVYLQAQVFVGRATTIGAGSWLMAGVVVSAECTVGSRVRLHPGVVIGGDGFGYEFVAGRHEKVPQVGTVILGDEVEIGANTTLDRSRFSFTRVGDGTKIDNLVQIGHNVVIGRHCLICAQVGIAGSTTLEDYVVLGGQVGVIGHITIGQGAMIGAQTGIGFDVPPKAAMWGTPALPHAQEQRISILRKKLPELFRRVSVLEEKTSIS